MANIQSEKVTEGSHEDIAPGSDVSTEAERLLKIQFKRFNGSARLSARGQLGFLTFGAFLYAMWLLTRVSVVPS